MFSWYKYLIVNLVFSHLGFWNGNLFLIAPFPDFLIFAYLYFFVFSEIFVVLAKAFCVDPIRQCTYCVPPENKYNVGQLPRTIDHIFFKGWRAIVSVFTHQDNMSVKYIPTYTPLLYSKTGIHVRRGIPIFIFAIKHRLLVLLTCTHNLCFEQK